MDDMVEKVARALRKDTEENGAGYCVAANIDWDAAARAAIEAMREPTEAMLDVGRAKFRKDGLLPAYTDAGGPGQRPIMLYMLAQAWPVMIDAALGSKGE